MRVGSSFQYVPVVGDPSPTPLQSTQHQPSPIAQPVWPASADVPVDPAQLQASIMQSVPEGAIDALRQVTDQHHNLGMNTQDQYGYQTIQQAHEIDRMRAELAHMQSQMHNADQTFQQQAVQVQTNEQRATQLQQELANSAVQVQTTEQRATQLQQELAHSELAVQHTQAQLSNVQSKEHGMGPSPKRVCPPSNRDEIIEFGDMYNPDFEQTMPSPNKGPETFGNLSQEDGSFSFQPQVSFQPS